MRPVVLGLHARLVHESAGIGGQPRHGASDVRVQLHDLLDTRRIQQRGRHTLLHRQNHAMRCLDADGGRAQLRQLPDSGAARSGSADARSAYPTTIMLEIQFSGGKFRKQSKGDGRSSHQHLMKGV